MSISKLLGATMVAGAVATGGAVAGIASASASSGTTTTSTAPSAPSTQGTTTTPRTTPTAPSRTAPPGGSHNGKPCPHMGSGQGSAAPGAYEGVAPGAGSVQ
jgi:hypothetical protein